jgi:hypothetical protein
MTEIDYMEYSSNATAQAAYVSTLDAYTKVCSHFTGVDGAASYTDPVAGAYTFAGTAQIDTAYSPFTGGSSLLLDGNSDYITLADSADWDFGTGDFTIDCWVRFANTTGYQGIIQQRQNNTTMWAILKTDAHKLTFFSWTGATYQADYVMTSAWSGLATDTWYHIAFVRTTTTAKLFIDGVSQALTETTAFGTGSMPTIAGTLDFGIYATANFFNGNIAELRITKGVARWTSDFTPPTVPYPNDLYCLSESTIKTQGSYSLKVTAAATTSLNKTLTKTF